ncbi:MAG: acetyl-CoA acetyltransferase [Thermoplasmata archaeon]|nr:acetyl-CoA acetyltransferase [Thermoplasmata archaeon]
MTKVGIIGIGSAGFKISTPELSWKELMFLAAKKAYEDAEVNPRTEVDSFITCAEDYWEGFSIYDEFTPDQLGAVLRSLCTVCADGLHGLANAYMQILSGAVDVVAVEAHSKASDLLSYNGIVLHAFDPIYNKPLGGHPYYVAGLEMKAYMDGSGASEEDLAQVVVKNKKNALKNPLAVHPKDIGIDDVMKSGYAFNPLKRMEMSELSDGCVVIVLAKEEIARKKDPVWLEGVGWASDTPWLGSRDWSGADYAKMAAELAFKTAKTEPSKIDYVEVDDKFSYKEPQHLEAMGFCKKGEARSWLKDGQFEKDGKLPVNVSGGSLGVGNLIEAAGLHRAYEAVLQLRKEAKDMQIETSKALVQSWRGVPTATGAVAIMGV